MVLGLGLRGLELIKHYLIPKKKNMVDGGETLVDKHRSA